jgi:predicted MFS family arabinose efflux permease
MSDTADYGPVLSTAGWAAVAPALRSRNFRLFWSGQSISLVGTSLQVVAEGWLIYEITGSTLWLGLVGFIALLPVVPISLLGGVLIDRMPRRKVILVTQCGLMAQATVFGLLAISGELRLPHIIFLYFIFGALLAIDHPARRAFLVDIVERDELANAVALNASSFNVARFMGFAVSGLLIATIGAGGTMLLNAATYLFPIWAMSSIRVPDIGQDTQQRPLGTAVSEGITTLWKQPIILATISLMAVVGGLAWPVYGMMPAFAEDVLGKGSIGLGVLLAVGALGSVIGTVAVTKVGIRRRGRTLMVVSLLLPVLVTGFALSEHMLVACLLVFGVGMLLLMLQSLVITLVQIRIPDRVRGRVMSLYSMVHAGSNTAGNLLVGASAAYLSNLPLTLALGGMAALIYALGVSIAMPALRRQD